MEYLLILSRVLFGGYFLMSGINHLVKQGPLISYALSKRVPLPKFAVVVTGLMLVMGGLGIIFYEYVPIAVLFIALFLVCVTPVMHDFWNEKDQMARVNSQISFMKNLALLGASIVYLFV